MWPLDLGIIWSFLCKSLKSPPTLLSWCVTWFFPLAFSHVICHQYKYVSNVVYKMQQLPLSLFIQVKNKMPSSKRSLQDPNSRPPPLKVTKDCFKAKKLVQADLRSPVIFHMHSPKVIHTRPQDFMRVVQMLTGQSSSFSPSSSSFSFAVVQKDEKTRANANSYDLGREFRFYS